MSRKYEKVNELLPIIRQRIEQGKTHEEIARELGLAGKEVIKNLLYRERQKQIQGLPRFRGRKPAKTLRENAKIRDNTKTILIIRFFFLPPTKHMLFQVHLKILPLTSKYY